ncbi:MAG: hypothetical protein LBG46_06275, partial [Elusimicrobiota bacterium]|nr:hypothetical protein [Elusimicrobiota bacterium]
TENFTATLDPTNSRVYIYPLGKRYSDSLSFCFDSAASPICLPTLGRVICSAWSNNSTQVEFCKSLSKTETTGIYSAWTLTSVD